MPGSPLGKFIKTQNPTVRERRWHSYRIIISEGEYRCLSEKKSPVAFRLKGFAILYIKPAPVLGGKQTLRAHSYLLNQNPHLNKTPPPGGSFEHQSPRSSALKKYFEDTEKQIVFILSLMGKWGKNDLKVVTERCVEGSGKEEVGWGQEKGGWSCTMCMYMEIPQ
jgi:hypothetical protein